MTVYDTDMPYKEIPQLTPDQLLRFFLRIKLRTDKNKCWPWKGSRQSQGYGDIRINNRCYLAHRLFYFIYYGEDPGGRMVLHECDNPRCVNPHHLHLGDAKMNIAEALDRGLIKNYTPTEEKTKCKICKTKLQWHEDGIRKFCPACIPEQTEANVKASNRDLKTHCIRGHEYTAENSYWYQPTGRGRMARICRECRTIHDKKRADKRKAVRKENKWP